ncbi:LPD7 domain-containing protein [Azohydromonas australica]|uniref:LPD7 domain-containing protein n=1 Tax=Azohydromonas australica TaxID=364039 RepID=UPI00042890F3|nr:LPD7 domain-containing protein [Azohydromonas australica]
MSSQLQEFRNSVYHRFMVGAHRRRPPVDIAQERAGGFQAMAQQQRPQELDPVLVRHWAVADLMSYQEANGASSQTILDVMRANAARHAGYRASIQALFPGLAAVGIEAPTYSRRVGASGALPLELEPAQPPDDAPAATLVPPSTALPRLPNVQEQAAARAIEQTYERLATPPGDTLDSANAEGLARSDAASLCTIENPAQRYFCAVAMGDSARRHSAYQAALEKLTPLVAVEVAAALREEDRRAASRQRMELAKGEFLLLQIEQRGEGLETASPAAAAEAARADAQAVRQIPSANERSLALLAMGWRAYGHDGYRVALRTAAPDVEKLASELQVRVEDGATNLPRDPLEDALLDAAVRGLARLPDVSGQLPLPMPQPPAPDAMQAQHERDVQTVADFVQAHHARTPEAVIRALAQAPVQVRQLLRDEERVRALDAEVNTKLAHLLPARVARIRALIATELGYAGAQALRDEAQRQEAALAEIIASANRPRPAQEMARDVRLAADFVQEYHARTPHGIAAGLAQAPAPVRALLANEQRMADIDAALDEKLAHLNPVYVAETKAVIAAALKNKSAQTLRAAADSQWAELAQRVASRQVPFESSRLLLVCVQGDLNGAHQDSNGLTLQAASPTDRNTLHFGVNAVTGASGSIAIIANPREMPVPAGWGQTDAWWRLRSHRDASGQLQRSLSVGQAVIVAPLGTVVPEGARVVFYEGGTAARDHAIQQVFTGHGAPLHEAGPREWTDWQRTGSSQEDHARWRRDTSSRLWPGHEAHIHLGGYETSTDHALEGVSLSPMLQAMRENGPVYTDATGAQAPYVDEMERRVEEVRRSVDRLLWNETPATEAALIAAHYRDLVQRLATQVESARKLDPDWQAEPFSFAIPDVKEAALPGAQRDAAGSTSEAPAHIASDAAAVAAGAAHDAVPAAGAAAPKILAVVPTAAHFSQNSPLAEAASDRRGVPSPVEMAQAVHGDARAVTPAQFQLGDAEVARAWTQLRDGDAGAGQTAVFDDIAQRHLGFTLPHDWTGQAEAKRGAMYVEPGTHTGIDREVWSVSVEKPNGGLQVVTACPDEERALALVDRLRQIASHSSAPVRAPAAPQDQAAVDNDPTQQPDARPGEQGARVASSSEHALPAQDTSEVASIAASSAPWREVSHVEQIRLRHTALRQSGRAVSELDAAEVSALAAADAAALRQIRTEGNLVAAVNEIMASAEERAYQEALRTADYQVAKAIESIRFDAHVQSLTRHPARRGGLEGVLLEQGTAPYQFQDNEKSTHYVKYRNDEGEDRTVWGRHLPAALIGAGAQVGDRIWLNRKRTPPELLHAGNGDLPCDLAEFALEVTAKAALLCTSPAPAVPAVQALVTAEATADVTTEKTDVSVPRPVQEAAAMASEAAPATAQAPASHAAAARADVQPAASGSGLSTQPNAAELMPPPTEAAPAQPQTPPASTNTATDTSTTRPPVAPATPPTQDLVHQDLLRRLAGLRRRDSERARIESGLVAEAAIVDAEPADQAAGMKRQHVGQDRAGATHPKSEMPARAAAAGTAPQQGPRLRPALDMTLDGFTGDPADARPSPTEHIGQLLESMTFEIQRNGSVLYLLRGHPAFIDHGEQILMHRSVAPDNDDALLAAVLMAKEKWGGKLEVTGSPDFKQRAIAILVKHNIDVVLKNPEQDAMRRQLLQSGPSMEPPSSSSAQVPVINQPVLAHAASAEAVSVAQQPASTAASTAAPARSRLDDGQPGAPAEAAAPSTAQVTASGASQAGHTAAHPSPTAPAAPVVVADVEAATEAAHAVHGEVAAHASVRDAGDAPSKEAAASQTLAGDLVPVDARNWWSVQHSGVEQWFVGAEREAELKRLGPQPVHGEVFWFDKAGRRCDPPEYAEEYKARLRAHAPEQHAGPAQVVLRGLRKNGDRNEVAVLLFKGEGNHLQGYLIIDGKRQPVIAHITQRAADPDTGEVRPNYLRLHVNDGNPKHPQWREIGYGNAINHRGDGKPVYFDEMLLNVGREVLKARVTGSVEPPLHRSLGFIESRKQRSAKEATVHALEGTTPKARPAAGEEVAAGAPRKGSRRSARARAAA